MRFRNDSNAATATAVILVFLLVGCAVAGGAWLLGVEDAVVKFGIVAYLCLAIPVIGVALAPTSPGHSNWRTFHLSFRPSPLPYLVGKRVKPRLRLFATLTTTIAGLAMLASMFFTVVAVRYFETLLGEYRGIITACMVVTWLIPYFLFRYALARAAVGMDWISQEEAREFVRCGRHWPDTWLEPLPGKPLPEKPLPGKPPR